MRLKLAVLCVLAFVTGATTEVSAMAAHDWTQLYSSLFNGVAIVVVAILAFFKMNRMEIKFDGGLEQLLKANREIGRQEGKENEQAHQERVEVSRAEGREQQRKEAEAVSVAREEGREQIRASAPITPPDGAK